MLVELVGETGVDEDRDETDEAQRDMYRELGSNSTDRFDEPDPCAPLDDRVELGRDEKEGPGIGEC